MKSLKKHITILFLLVSIGSSAFNADSLKRSLDTAKGENRCKILYTLQGHYINSNLDSSVQYGTEMIQLTREMENRVFETAALSSMGYAYNNFEKYSKALEYMNLALYIALEDSNSKWLAEVYCGLGTIYKTQYNYDLAQEYFRKGIKHAKIANHTWFLVKNMNNLASIFADRGELELVLKTRKEIIKILKESDSFKGTNIPIMYNNLGAAYRYLGIYDSAITSFNSCIPAYIKIGYHDLASLAYVNLVFCYTNTGQYDSAKYCLMQADFLSTERQSTVDRLFRLEAEGELCLEIQQAQKAISIALEIQRISSEDSTLISSYTNSYDILHKAYKQLGNFKLALVNYRTNDSLKEMVTRKTSIKEIQSLRAFFETEMDFEKQKRALKEAGLNEEIQRKEAEKQKNWRNFIIVLSILGLFLSILIVNRFKLKAKASRAMREQLELEKENLKLQIEHKNRELTSTSMFVAQKNKLLMDLQEHLKEFKGVQGDGVQKQLRNLRNEIKSNIHLEEDWDNIKLHFDEVYPSFFENLTKQFPGLTNLELKHSAYLKMNLSVKEVARMLSVAPKSVQMSHYRLKKKLALGPNDSLSVFLDQL